MKFFFTALFFLSLLIQNVVFAQDSLINKIQKAKNNLENALGKFKKDKSKQANNTNNQETVNNQKPATKTENEVAKPSAEYITIKAPNSNFKDIVINKYKNKPLLVDNNLVELMFCSGLDGGAKADVRQNYFEAIRYYTTLIVLRSRDSIFNHLDTTNLTPPAPGMLNPQVDLARLGSMALSNSIVGKYFCKSGTCKVIPSTNKPIISQNWGGNTANEFERNDAYLAFIKDKHHITLRKWWNSISTQAFCIQTSTIKPYNFEKKCFELTVPPPPMIRSIAYELYSSGYKPKEKYEAVFLEKNGQIKYSIDKTLPMSIDEAKKVKDNQEKNREFSYYFVYSITLNRDNSFSLNSPVIEVYDDRTLTHKICDLNLTKQD